MLDVISFNSYHRGSQLDLGGFLYLAKTLNTESPSDRLESTDCLGAGSRQTSRFQQAMTLRKCVSVGSLVTLSPRETQAATCAGKGWKGLHTVLSCQELRAQQDTTISATSSASGQASRSTPSLVLEETRVVRQRVAEPEAPCTLGSSQQKASDFTFAGFTAKSQSLRSRVSIDSSSLLSSPRSVQSCCSQGATLSTSPDCHWMFPTRTSSTELSDSPCTLQPALAVPTRGIDTSNSSSEGQLSSLDSVASVEDFTFPTDLTPKAVRVQRTAVRLQEPSISRDVKGMLHSPSGTCVTLDADCCGDSGAVSLARGVLLCPVPEPAEAGFTRPVLSLGLGLELDPPTEVGVEQQPESSSGGFSRASVCGSQDLAIVTETLLPLQRTQSTVEEEEPSSSDVPGGSETPRQSARGRGLSEGQAAVELFLRLNHARQTVDFVHRQAATFSRLERDVMDSWEALELLNQLREYESALLGDEGLDPDLPLMEHAFQTAEACRLAFPTAPWLHVVGLIHGLGKLLAHKRIGGEPQWAVCGESFPVGCRFSQNIVCPQFFSVNPDRRRRLYNTPTGMYKKGCGLQAVFMSWSAPEYLYMVLVLNKTRLPPEALFILRYQKFNALLRPGGAYHELLSDNDRLMVPWLQRFQELSVYKRREIPGMLQGAELRRYYSDLLARYIPQGQLRW